MDARGRLVFLGLGLAVGAFAGGGVTWIVGSQMRARFDVQQEAERAAALESNRRALIERGWRSARAEPMSPDEMKAALSQCDADARDLPERVGRERARQAAERR